MGFLFFFCFFCVVGAQPWISPEFPIEETVGRLSNRLSPDSTVCRYCLCDRHTQTVTCASKNLRLKTIVLPQWAESFHAHNVSAPEFPHFTYHPRLKILRLNFCSLRNIHSASLASLPNLELIDFGDNRLESLPEGLFDKLSRLRILNLQRNLIGDLNELKWKIAEGTVLEELHLNANPIRMGISADSPFGFPLVRKLFLSETNIWSLNSTHLVFRDSAVCPNSECRSVVLSEKFWSSLRSLDLSANSELRIDDSALSYFSNLTSLRLSGCPLPSDFGEWLQKSAIRHLDLNGCRLNSSEWRFCSPALEWLDISGMGIRSLDLDSDCVSLQWIYAEKNILQKVRISARSLLGIHLAENLLEFWPLESGADVMPYGKLEYLSLGNNRLETIPERALNSIPQLADLDLSENRLVSLSRNSMPTLELHLKNLNLSGNYLEKFEPPILPSLISLDLSANNLGELNADFWRAVPILQRLRLSHNPQRMRIDWALIDTHSQLAHLDISHNLLHSIPDLHSFPQLRSLSLRGNQITYLDANRLPSCLLSLDISENLVHFVGNFSADQLVCMKEMDIGLNPLSCDCSLAALLPLLEHQSGYDDRNQYYCFADKWQHPLKAYVQNAASCREKTTVNRFVPLFLNFLAMLTACVVAASVVVCLTLKLCAIFGKRVVPFAYKPVIQSDLIVDL